MRFDQSFIEQVRNSISIVDLVSGYVRLQKKGKDHAALCPVHHEKTPSFLVSESKGIFKCFGCGVGGDIFEFVMLLENLTFPESVQHLAERYGIALPQASKESGQATEKRQQLLQIMEMATQFFRKCLKDHQQAKAYLKGRGIADETLEQFSIGYAPPGRHLLDQLRSQGVGVEQALACGLVREGKPGENYDRFRNRVILPIRDLSGKTIAFGGRILGDGLPKYLNSPETPLYSKGNHLFPLNITRDEIRRRDFAVLVEGYFDCIVPYQFGVRNIAASLGTSLTANQVKVLGRYTRNVVINFDPDSAGTAAAMRSIDLFLEQGFRVNVVQLRHGEDPDTFIQKEGGPVYWELVKNSHPFLDFALSQFVEAQKDPYGPKGKQEIVSQIAPYLAKVPHRIERAEYVTRIASRLQIDEQLLAAELGKIAHKPGVRELKPHSSLDRITPAERTLLVAVLDEHWQGFAFQQLGAELFEGLVSEEVFGKVLELKSQGQEISALQLRNLITDEQGRDLVESLALGSSEVRLSEEIVQSSVQALRKKRYERLSLQLQDEIRKEEQDNSESARMEELLIKKERIRRQISEVESLSHAGTGD